ncbi:hypothetical protein RhiLY_05978 [Ceratobasidium sp. AG-Ba]|nr:hypothetical protein RhiLY_05978 [Ceratobasidium sp. AG-Ba]
MSTLAAHSMMALKSQRSRLQTPSDSLSTVDSYAHRGSTFAGSQEPAPPAILDPINHLSPQIPRESSPVAQVAELLPPVEQTDPASHRYVASRVIHDVSKSTTSPFRTIASIQLKRFAETMNIPPLEEREMEDFFMLLFFNMLLHSVYRPQDWSKRILLLVDHEDEDSLRQLHANWNQEPPTHILGFTASSRGGYAALFRGVVDQVSSGVLDVHLTAYGCPPERCQGGDLMVAMSNVEDLIRRNLGDTYRLQRFIGYPALWPSQAVSWDVEAREGYFCQLISTVVHEHPFWQEVEWTKGVVHPIWPVYLVEEKLKLVLQQIHREDITLQAVLSGTGTIPDCVYLHGDRLEVYADPTGEPGEEIVDLDRQEWPDQPNWDKEPNHVISGVEDWETVRKFFKGSYNSVVFQAETPSSTGSSLARSRESSTHTMKRENEMYTMLLEQSRGEFLSYRGHSPIARVAFWQQFRSSEPGLEAISFLTVHLWLSAMSAIPSGNVFYVDPVLANQLVQRSSEDVLPLAADDYSCMWGRERLWPGMAEDAHVVTFMRLNGLIQAREDAWVMIDLHVLQGSPTRIEVLLPPCNGVDNEVLNSAIGTLVGRLNQVLPRPSVTRRTCTVQQSIKTLLMPRPLTEEMVWLAMIAHLCGLFLGQKVDSVDISVFRQNMCFYYNQALRGPTVDCALPWNGLMDKHGFLQTTESAPRVSQARLSLASNREPSPAEALPRRTSYSARLVSPGPSAPFFTELALPETQFPEDMLIGVSGRSVEHLEACIFLGRYPSWPDSFPDRRTQVPDAMSLDDYCDLVHSVGGPESLAGQKLIMMGEHDNERLKLDWLRDAAHLELEWLMASMDVDSLSLTTQEAPVFQQAGSFYPYPNRSTAISTRNELKVLVDGSEFEMHTCPNFCTMSFGANNQFRLLVFFPRIQEKITDRMYRNFANQKEMSDWYYVILLALHDLEDDIPEEWRHALTKTIEALPLSYRAAEKLCCPKKAPRSFIGYRIEPYIMNLALERARKIIDDKPEYAMYRGYFFHLCGINLKLATQNIHGREDENPLNHVFRLNPFIDWYAQNPNNITVDVGLAVNLDRRMVPEELKRSTLLIRYWALRELMRPAYTQPQQDRYCHSYVISGLRSTPLASHRARSGMSKFQAYHKDMNAQYVRQDRSVGWNFTVAEALGLGHRTTFSDEMEGYRESIELAGCYGTRYEWRLSAWAANRLLLYEPQDILRRLFNAGVIVCHPTSTISNHKLIWNRGWASVLNRQRALSKRSRLSPEVQLLAAVLAYWLKGLVKRPDDMSSSRAMSNGLMLSSNAKDYGLPSLRIDVLHEDCLRVRHSVDANSFKIIKQNSVIRPGGLRVKSSRALSGDQRQVDSPPTTPACPSRMPAGPLSVSADFVLDMVNVQLPRAIWARFPEDRMSQGSIARNLRKGPLKLRHWSKVVEPLNEPLTVVNKFHTALDKLFPQIGLRPFEQATLGLTIEKSCSLFGVTCQPSRSLRGTPIPKH